MKSSLAKRARRGCFLWLVLLPIAGCSGRQSVLDPAGTDAIALSNLFWVMLVSAVVLWCLVATLFIYVTRVRTGSMPRRWAETLIIGGGIVFPLIVLSALLVYSLPQMSPQRSEGDGLVVRITAEQWWWRVEYLPEGSDTPIVSANEVRLPRGARSEFVLNAHNVIHSFWIPALGGKTDMIPGRETFMSLEPTKTGIFRGQCAEFCGASHALMAFEAVVMEPDDFDTWLAVEARDAVSVSAEAEPGQALFEREGCGACHAVRGTSAIGRVGPDLTHVGSRKSLGAGILPMTPEALADWIGHTGTIKPEVNMPSYDHLDPDELRALGLYLEALE